MGKSKILERYLLDDFKPRQRSTYALTLYRHTVVLPGGGAGGAPDRALAVDIWDTAGQERFAALHPSYYHRAHVAVLVFDVTRKATYTNLASWYAELRRYCPTIPVLVVANKVDVDASVLSKAFAWPGKNGLPLHYVSAADGTNVVRVFADAVAAGVAHKEGGPRDFADEVAELLAEPLLGQGAFKPAAGAGAAPRAGAASVGAGAGAGASVGSSASTGAGVGAGAGAGGQGGVAGGRGAGGVGGAVGYGSGGEGGDAGGTHPGAR